MPSRQSPHPGPTAIELRMMPSRTAGLLLLTTKVTVRTKRSATPLTLALSSTLRSPPSALAGGMAATEDGPLRGEGNRTTPAGLRIFVPAFIVLRRAHSTVKARRTLLELADAVTAPPSPLNGPSSV